FAYGEGILAAKATGLVWDQALMAEYVRDPTRFIDTHGGSGASKMVFRLPVGGEDIAAYLETLK
ncbi:MAG TPA: cytochrome C, partial [Paenirhodobacter sp.]